MAKRSYLLQKWHAERDALAKEQRRKRGGIARARHAFKRTTLALLRDEVNHRQIAPALAAKTAKRNPGQPSLFGDIA